MKHAVMALLLGCALVLTACQKTTPGAAAPARKVRLAFTNQPQCALVHIALAQGYFRAEGLEIEPVMRTFGKAALQAMLDQQADIATAAETPIMFNILQGRPLRVIANIVASDTNNGVVARRDAGIGAVADLRGKRIGYTPGTTSDFFLSSLLTANGIARSGVREVDLKPEEMAQAMQSGQVDAVSTWNYPLSQMRRALGPNGLILYDKNIYTETFNLVALQDFIAHNPETVQRFLRALIKAEDFARNAPQQAQAIMAATARVEPDLVREVWDSFQFRVGLDQILLLTLEDETRWAISNGLTRATRMPDYLSHLYFDGLDAVRPDAVRIKR